MVEMSKIYDLDDPLQQELRPMAEKIDEQASQYMEAWKQQLPVDGFDADNFWSRENLELVRDSGVPAQEIYAYIVTGIYEGAPDSYWHFVMMLSTDFRVAPNSLLYSPSIDTALNVHWALRHLDSEYVVDWILAMWRGVHYPNK